MISLPPARRIELPAQRDADGNLEAPITLSVHDAGEGPAVVFSHGFPELAWSWRHQAQPLIDAGYRVIIPDQRGYGASDRPEAITAYDIDHLTGDLVGVLDVLEVEKAVFVGHDWGGFVVWAMPTLHPERTAGVIGVNTPYTARGPIPPTQMMRALVNGDDSKMYVLWFQEPGVAEDVMDKQAELIFEKLMRSARPPAEMAAKMMETGTFDMNPFNRLEGLETVGDPILSAEELAVYTDTFTRTGFAGGINWYRNFDRNWERHPEIGTTKISVPSLMVTAEWDGALPPAMAADMPTRCEDLEMVQIDECGHWTQQEEPERLNAILLDWLNRRLK
jgi:pimeloyl-ACP methyl ester carboxylesterase